MSGRVKMLVVASLALNVFLVGIIIGHLSQRLDRQDVAGRQRHRIAGTLPRDKEQLFLRTMERLQRENRDIHRAIREMRKRTLAILTAPEFDEVAYQAAVAQLHELRGRMMGRLAEATRYLANRFNQAERRALADHLRRPSAPQRDAQGLHRGGGPPPQDLPLPEQRP